jgi:hypothetical protein
MDRQRYGKTIAAPCERGNSFRWRRALASSTALRSFDVFGWMARTVGAVFAGAGDG